MRKPWSRPLSESFAEQWDRIPHANEFQAHKLLVVGGNYNFIPEWLLQSPISIKHVGTIKDIEDILDNFTPDAVLIYVKATDGHTKHVIRDFSKHFNIPQLTMSRGWSDLILDARQKGVNWLVEIYPYKIVPLDYHERRKRTQSKKLKRKKDPSLQLQRFRSIRGERLASKGITTDLLKWGSTRYLDSVADKCVLCGKDIRYRYQLVFSIPGRDAIKFFPVGSICIEDWANSIPEAVTREKAKNKVRKELQKEPQNYTQSYLFDLD